MILLELLFQNWWILKPQNYDFMNFWLSKMSKFLNYSIWNSRIFHFTHFWEAKISISSENWIWKTIKISVLVQYAWKKKHFCPFTVPWSVKTIDLSPLHIHGVKLIQSDPTMERKSSHWTTPLSNVRYCNSWSITWNIKILAANCESMPWRNEAKSREIEFQFKVWEIWI